MFVGIDWCLCAYGFTSLSSPFSLLITSSLETLSTILGFFPLPLSNLIFPKHPSFLSLSFFFYQPCLSLVITSSVEMLKYRCLIRTVVVIIIQWRFSIPALCKDDKQTMAACLLVLFLFEKLCRLILFFGSSPSGPVVLLFENFG